MPVPKPLTNFAFTLAGQSLQLGLSAAGLRDLPDVCAATLSLDAWTPTPAVSVVRLPVSSHSASAFPQRLHGRHSANTRTTTSVRTVISGLQSFLYVQASRFAGHPGRSYRYGFPPQGSCDFYFRAPYELLPPHTSDMLAVRFGQLTAGDFHPISFAGLSAASNRFNGFSCFPPMRRNLNR